MPSLPSWDSWDLLVGLATASGAWGRVVVRRLANKVANALRCKPVKPYA